MEGVLDLGEVGGEKAAVGADGVAAQRHLRRVGDMGADELQDGRPRLRQRDGRLLDLRQQPALCVHGSDDAVHRRQRLGRLVHDDVGPLGDQFEVVVGDQAGDLHDRVLRGVEPRHLEVHPDEH